MSVSLYDVSVLGFIQAVDALSGVLDKGLAHCEQAGIDPQDIVETRLYPDMQPFRFQVFSVIKHSAHAIECAKVGRFGPPPHTPDVDYAGLQGLLKEAAEQLRRYAREDIEALQGQAMDFEPGSIKVRFQVEDFLMSFSIPNVHFHATTAYDILRMRGVPLGKRDYLGRMRVAG